MYKIKARHRLSFHMKDSGDVYLGDLVSYDDNNTPISSSLCVYNYVRFDDYQVMINPIHFETIYAFTGKNMSYMHLRCLQG